ncbi:6-phospho-3-hexuloisomerase [Dactylosporangium sp. NPDC000521]|uniref:6-phospho-3-hexuloisomerase n=1 Tax=Dactylosporangium sp. NPDC000521 TaxID=3363975 RepID=UPI0036BFB49B
MTGTTHRDHVDTILAEITASLRTLDPSGLTALADAVLQSERVFVTGEGRSGFMARAFAMRLMHLGTQVYFVGDTCTPALTAGDLVIAVSGSGTTASTLRTVQAAAANGCRIAAVTSDPASALGTAAEIVAHVPGATKHRRAGEPSSIQPLSSLFDQCVHLTLDAVCLAIATRRDIDNATAVKAHANTE